MSEQEKSTSQLPANLASLGNALATSVASLGDGAGDGFLSFKKGAWVFGVEQLEVEEGSRWAINPNGLEHGYVCWGDDETDKDGTLLGEKMVPATMLMPDASKLPDHEDGTWAAQIAMQVCCVSGEDSGIQLKFNSCTVGGRKMYQTVVRAIVNRIQANNPAVVPIVELAYDSYMHKNKKYGEIFTPIMEIVDWATLDGLPETKAVEANAAEQTTAETAEETAPVPEEPAPEPAEPEPASPAAEAKADSAPAGTRRRRRANRKTA